MPKPCKNKEALSAELGFFKTTHELFSLFLKHHLSVPQHRGDMITFFETTFQNSKA